MNKIERKKREYAILLVEPDELLTRMFLRFWRPQDGLQVICERNEEAGLKRLDVCSPDIVVVDIDVYWEGIDLSYLSRLRQRTDCSILVIASLIYEAEEVAILDAGADGCFSKPVNLKLLSARMRALHRHFTSSISG
jgi:DNA-binding response OmpR family regulator